MRGSIFLRTAFYIVICDQLMSAYSLTCASSENLYLLEGQLIQMIPDKLYQMRLEACESYNSDIKPQIFDVHTHLLNVTEIRIQEVELPPLPDSSRLEKVTIVFGSPTKAWGSCKHLKWLKLVLSSLYSMHRDWLANCTELRYLALNKPDVQEVQIILDSPPRLEVLDIYMEDLTPIMDHPWFPTARGREKSLKELRLDVSWGVWENSPAWTDVTAALIWQLSRAPSLRLLSLSEFHSLDFCATAANYSSVQFKALEWLSLGKTSTSRLCFKEFRAMPQLHYLDLKNTAITELKFSELVSTRAPLLHVEFMQLQQWQNAQLKSLVFDEEDYLALTDGSKKGNVTVSMLDDQKIRIECECKNAWFARAAREGLVTAPNVVCHGGAAPGQLPPERIECDKYTCESCQCYQLWKDRTVKADCTGLKLFNLSTDLLAVPNLRSLLAPRNGVERIPTSIPDGLLYLDLSDNKIWKLDAQEVYALFGVKSRHLRFAGNPILCSCENEYLLNALMENSARVDDYDDIKCVGSNVSLKYVDISELCAERDHEAAVVRAVVCLSILSAVFVVMLGVALYYRRTIKIFLFARGWCLCCVEEDEIDSNRVFDVFLSFCHSDEIIVTNELLPILDKEYKVCVHFRDWVPGNLIPTQISNSVELSRRTVVVVSRNFVKSVWGVLEFRTAHMSALQEGRIRVVAVVLDDVLEDETLQGELKGYLRTNTYLKWGDPWFWDKLRYALPHRPAGHTQKVSQKVSDNAAYENSNTSN